MTAAPNTQQIEFSFLQPSNPISTNEKMHWAQKRRELKPWREAIHKRADELLKYTPDIQFPIRHCVIQFTFGFRTNHRRDRHNYTGTMVKALTDELVIAKVLEDDKSQWLEVRDSILTKGNKCEVRIELLEAVNQ